MTVSTQYLLKGFVFLASSQSLLYLPEQKPITQTDNSRKLLKQRQSS